MEDNNAFSRLIPTMELNPLVYHRSTVIAVCLPYLTAVQTECPQVINALKTPDLWMTHYSAVSMHRSPLHLNDESASAESMHFPADCP